MLNMNNSMPESIEIQNGERGRADDALRWNEERYRTLFDLDEAALDKLLFDLAGRLALTL